MFRNNTHHNIVNNINNCTITDLYIREAIADFTVDGAKNIDSWWTTEHVLKYKNGPQSPITKNHFFDIGEPKTFWTPIFIDANTNEQKISDIGVYNKTTIGVNEYLSFVPHFKKYFRANNAQAIIPWKLNSDEFPHQCQYGLLCWVSSVGNENNSETNNISWNNIPHMVPFWLNSIGPYIKLDSERILTFNNIDEPIAPTRGQFLENKYVKNDPKLVFGENFESLIYTLNPRPDNNYRLWIADGDVFSYRELTGGAGIPEKSYISAALYQIYNAIYYAITINRKRSFSRNLNESRRYKNLAKYLATSPFITNFAIDAMTKPEILDIVQNHINGGIDLSSTLINISRTLNDYNNTNQIDYNLQQLQLNNIIDNTYDLVYKLKNKYGIRLSMNNGSISYSEDLRYKDDIAITNVYSIITKNASHYENDSSYLALCQNIKTNNYTISSTINGESTVLDSNKAERAIDILSLTKNNTFSKSNFIPLYDSVEPKWKNDLGFVIAMKFVNNLDERGPSGAEWDPDNVVYQYSTDEYDPELTWVTESSLTNQHYITFKIFNDAAPETVDTFPYFSIDNEARKQFSFRWEPVSGPPIKFTDYNVSTDGLYDTSSADEVKLVFSDYAKYTIKCTISSPFGVFTIYKTFFVTNFQNRFKSYNVNEYGSTLTNFVSYTEDPVVLSTYTPERANYGGPILSEKLQQSTTLNPNRYSFKFIKAGGFKKIAVNARGLIWFIDTSFKVARFGFLENYIEKLAGPIYKVQCVENNHVTDPIPELSDPYDIYHDETTKTRPLTIDYIISSSDSTAKVYIDKIILENIRNGSDECSQCISTYGGDMRGVTVSAGVGQKTLAIDRINSGFTLTNLLKQTETIAYSLPEYSLDYSPKLFKYGRYTNDEFLTAIKNTTSIFESPLVSESSYGTNTILGATLPDHPVPNSQNEFYPPITGYDLAAERTNTYEPDSNPGSDINKYKICYQKALDVIASGDTDRDFYINFNKGIFHPNSGWINDTQSNKSHVLKFNPGARDTFAFKGPAIASMNSSDITYNVSSANLLNATISQGFIPNIFSSAVSIGIAKGVQWDPLCECPPDQDASDFEREQFALKSPYQILLNQLHKEYADQQGYSIGVFGTGDKTVYQSWHGYRILGGGVPKDAEQTTAQKNDVNDEFVFSTYNAGYKNNTFIYEFAVTGPANKLNEPDQELYNIFTSSDPLPTGIRNKTLNLRDPRVNDFTIKDIEVKLNFLNYVNTQDLIIWLEVTPCASEFKRLVPKSENPVYPSPISSPPQFINQLLPPTIQRKDPNIDEWSSSVIDSNELLNSTYFPEINTGRYLKHLIDVNSNNPGENIKIYLLNQEYIQNNKYNFSIKFSDHASVDSISSVNLTKYNPQISGDALNTIDFIPGHNRKIIESNDCLLPTQAAMGFNEIDHSIYRNIIKNNFLTATSNTFSKLYGKQLFLEPAPDEGPCQERTSKQRGPSLSSRTTFTLKIAIVDEPDIMDNYDNIINSAILTNFIPEHNQLTSSDMFNNLCNWELILHTDSTIKPAPYSGDNNSYGNNDVLSLIKYHKSPIDNGYYGYNFIADLTDKQFLLPLVNLNAPYQYIQDVDICAFPDASNNPRGSLILNPPVFPTSAIVSILAGVSAAGSFVGGEGLAGAGSFGAGSNNAYRDIISYFQEAQRWRNLDSRLRQLYNISHTNYPYGSPEKVLLNISKDGGFWYNLEAVIFKLSNTPILNRPEIKPLLLTAVTGTDNLTPDLELKQLLSEFSYDIVENPIDLIDNSFIKYDIKLNCEEFSSSLDTSFITTDQNSANVVTLKPYDIFKITIDIDSSSECDDYRNLENLSKLYIYIPDGGNSWKSDFSSFLYNNTLTSINSMLSNYWWNNNILIKINSIIPFDIINIGDRIELFNNSERNISNNLFNVQGKAKVLLDNKYYTIFGLSAINSTDTTMDIVKNNSLLRIDPTEQDVIAIVQPALDNASGNIYSNPFSQWRFEYDNYNLDTENINQHIVPHVFFSTNSRGSYGDASPKIQKNYLHYIETENKINKLYDLFDSHVQYKQKYNNIWARTSVTGELNLISGKTTGFNYSLKDIVDNQNSLFNSDIKVITTGLGTLEEDHYSNSYKYQTQLIDNKYEVIYLKNSTFKNALYGNIDSIEDIRMDIEGIGSFGFNITCDPVPTGRIAELDGDIDDALVTEFSSNIRNYNGFFNNYPSIKTALAYYENIASEQNTVDNINLVTKIKNNVELLFEERNNLIKLQQLQPTSGIATIKYNILRSDNNVNRYYTTKTINNNYYWIHIDPKQSCSISEELRPKVLKATKYSCVYLNPNINTTNSIDNNICPLTAGRDIQDGGIEDFKYFDSMSFPGDPVLGFTYGYHVPSGTVENNKENLTSKYSSIAGWKEETIYRTFYMNSTKDISDTASNPDYIIYVEEIYEAAVPAEHMANLNDALSGGLIHKDGSADSMQVPGIPGGCTIGSPAGFGLAGQAGGGLYRLNVPTRVCNIFNLDSTDTIKVKFRKIPRVMRGVDFLGTVFRFGATAQYRQVSTGQPLSPLDLSIGQGSLNNQLYMWQCFELDKDKKLVSTQVSDLMAILNEMAFRAFYGSVDGIEHRNKTLINTEYAHQLIPFEYFFKPPPQNNTAE
jgi:hypothetical protein